MKKSLLYFLTFFFAISLASCSKDDNSESSYDQGKAKGTEFITSYNAYKAAGSDITGTATKLTEGAKMYLAYIEYKNSTDAEYKAGFIAGAGSGITAEALNGIGNITNNADGYLNLYNAISSIITPTAK